MTVSWSRRQFAWIKHVIWYKEYVLGMTLEKSAFMDKPCHVHSWYATTEYASV